MSQKLVAIYEVGSFSKQRTDQKSISDQNEECVTTELTPDSFNPGRGLYRSIFIYTTDSQSPDWSDHFVVTIEKLDPPPAGAEWREYLKDVVEKKKQEGDANAFPTGRKFR